MAEVIGLAASLIQIAGAGVQLSTSLYKFVGSANRADADIADIADDVQITANTLDSVGKVFEREGGTCVVSRKAVQDAESLIKRCEAVFAEIQLVIDKRRKTGKDGRRLSTVGKFSWPMKEPRVELSRKRLESLKTSLQLLLQVILLASGQAKGKLEKQTLEKERGRVRELHQRQQESLKALQALEKKLEQTSLSDDETLHGSTQPSRVPTIDLMVNTSNLEPRIQSHGPNPSSPKPPATTTTMADDLESPGDEETPTEDEKEHLSTDELTQCVGHVKKLLHQIQALQQNIEDTPSTSACPRHRVRKLYRRFCASFESEMASTTNGTQIDSVPLPEFLPPSKEVQPPLKREVQIPSREREFHPGPTTPHSSYPVERESTFSYTARQLQHPPVPANLQTDETHHANKPETLRRPSMHGGHDRLQYSDTKARSDVPSRGSSKESFQNAFAEEDEQVLQGPGEVHRTKTGRISKAKKGLKVHSCECGKSYTRAEHLRRHQKNHTSDDVVQCNLCGKTFYRRDLLERHIGRHKERLAAHDDANRAEPSSTPSAYNYTWTAESMRFGGAGVSSASSEPSTAWALPSPSTLEGPQYTSSSGEARLPLPYGPPMQVSPSVMRPASIQAHVQGEYYPRTHASDERMEIASADRSNGNAAHASPSEQNIDKGGHASPHNPPVETESAVITERRAGLDTGVHHSGFTPVNSVPPGERRSSYHVPGPHQATNPKTPKGRRGPLSSDQRALASQMRSISACVNCQQLKQKCDAEVPCGNCRRHAMRPNQLPEPTCRGQSLADIQSAQGSASQTHIVDGSRHSVNIVRQKDLAIKPTPSPTTAPTDEVLQRLVEEAGSDKRLESSRADRKAFFDSHWALPQCEIVAKPEPQKLGPSGKATLESSAPYDPKSGAARDVEPNARAADKPMNSRGRLSSDASESVDVGSPPPEPADKTSEEWISWKRARLSEGARKAAKRKRDREEKTDDTSLPSPSHQSKSDTKIPVSPFTPTEHIGRPLYGPQKTGKATVAATVPADTETKTHQRKRSKLDHVSSEENDSRGDTSEGQSQRDQVMGERDEEDKDIVDMLLEQWTVPV